MKLGLAALMLFSQGACVSAPATTTRMIYRTPGTVSAQWSRIQDECNYEAEKATASASLKTPTEYRRFRLFNMCAKLKGATFVGKVTMPDAEWERISMHCKAEARTAVAKQAASRGRDELQEDLEIDCAKRNGAVFRQDYYP